MENLVKEQLNFKTAFKRLEKRQDLSTKYLDYQLEIISWHELPNSKYIPSSIKAQEKLVLAYKHLNSKVSGNNGLENSSTNGDGIYHNGNSILEDSDTEESDRFPVVRIGEARSLLSLFCTWKEESTRPCTPFWVMCDGKAPEHVFLMGCSWLTENSGQYMVNTYSISCQGPYQSKNKLPSVSYLMDEYSQTTVCNVTAKGYAQYDVLGTTFAERTMIEPGGETNVLVECEWEDVETMLEVPHGAKCQLSVKAVPGDSRIASYGMYQELHTLKGFITGIKKGTVEWMSYSDEGLSFFKKLETLLDEEETTKVGRVAEVKKFQEEEGNCESPLQHKFIPPRKNLDFTERLWNLLKDAGSLQDLKTALQNVMETLQTGDFYPVVHVNNNSRLASEIRACYQQQTPNLNLEGVEPLKILIELGLEKLRRDYTDFFIRKEVVLHEQLGFFLKSDLSSDNQIERLCRMHNVLELLVTTAMLNLPLENQQALCRLGLKYYEKSSNDINHTFQLPVEASNLYGIYSTSQPCLWSIDITPNGLTQSSTLYQLTVTPPFNAALSSTDDETRLEENFDGLTYYSTHVQRNCVKPM